MCTKMFNKIQYIIQQLENKEVSVPKRLIPNKTTRRDYLHSIQSELEFGWVLGQRNGFDAITFIPNDANIKGDVDLVIDLNCRYCIQVKSPFMSYSRIQRDMFTSGRMLAKGKGLTPLSGFHSKMEQVDRGLAGILKPQSAYSLPLMARKTKQHYSKARKQLRAYPNNGIFAYDLRGYPSYSETDIIKSIHVRFQKGSSLAGCILLSNTPFTLKNRNSYGRIIGIPNKWHDTQYDREDWQRMGYSDIIQPYQTKPFMIITSLNFRKGWNDWMEINGRRVVVDDIEIGRL